MVSRLSGRSTELFRFERGQRLIVLTRIALVVMVVVVLVLQIWSRWNSRSSRWKQLFYPSMMTLGILTVLVSVANYRDARRRHES